MNDRQKTIRAGLLAAAIAALVGCSSAPKDNASPAAKITLPAPSEVPVEKWSDAMHVFTAMRLSGQRDVPREMAKSFAGQPASSSSAPAGDAVTTGLSYYSTPTGMSSGAAVGVGLGLMLLGGGNVPAGTIQIVAWVPSELANSPEQASAIALKAVEDARRKVFIKGLSKVPMKVGKYPTNSGKSYASPKDIYWNHPVAFDEDVSAAPAFISGNSGKAYGPIFIRNNSFALDASKNDMSVSQAISVASSQMPRWIYIYHPGQKLRKDSIPPAIYNSGEALYFIGK